MGLYYHAGQGFDDSYLHTVSSINYLSLIRFQKMNRRHF